MSAHARCLVLSNGVVGAEKQALALAEAIGLSFEVRRVKQVIPALSRLPSSVLASATHLMGGVGVRGIGRIDSPYPALAISCGRGSIPASIALRDAGRGFLVQRLGHGRRAALRAQRPDDHRARHAALAQRDLVAGSKLARGLRRRAVDGHAALADLLHRQRAGLEEARRPQPLVQARAVGVVVFRHWARLSRRPPVCAGPSAFPRAPCRRPGAFAVKIAAAFHSSTPAAIRGPTCVVTPS